MATKTQQESFIKNIGPLVQKYAPKYGISTSVCSAVIAQACLESDYGTSYKAKYHNYFGLKFRKNRLTVNKGYFEDGGSEQNKDGSYTLLPSDTAWYSFENMEKGVEGYFQFINISNYSSLKGETDPLKYLEKIKAANYATSNDYVKNVYNVIKSQNLTVYDIKSNTNTSKNNTANNSNNKNIIVGIDSGHGSETGGKRSPDGYREHYSNTYIAYYLDKILQANGFKTVKVAWNDNNVKDDPEVSLGERQNKIRNAGCTISVSIHANAFGDGKSYNSANGVETFYHSTYPNDSAKLAKCVQDQLVKGTPQTNRGVKTSNFALCNCNTMKTKASILVEVAFMTNKKEADLLKSDAFMRECAKEIAQGIFNYFGISGNTNIGVQTMSDLLSTNKNTISIPTQTTTTKTTTTKTPSTSTTKTPIPSTSTANKSTSTNTGDKFMYNGLDYSPVFNYKYYSDLYPDLKKAFGYDKQKLFNHFITYGMKEQRMACGTFNPIVYRKNYVDLQNAFKNNYPEYYRHYIVYGIKEKRKAY